MARRRKGQNQTDDFLGVAISGLLVLLDSESVCGNQHGRIAKGKEPGRRIQPKPSTQAKPKNPSVESNTSTALKPSRENPSKESNSTQARCSSISHQRHRTGAPVSSPNLIRRLPRRRLLRLVSFLIYLFGESGLSMFWSN